MTHCPPRQRSRTPRTRRRLVWRAVGWVALVVLMIGVAYGRIDIQAVHAYAARLNGVLAFTLLVVLPLVGFPASVLHVAAGIRFGPAHGLALVSASIVLQLLASYALVRRWREPFARRFAWVRRRLPHGTHAAITVFAALLPGVPFFAVNYGLALIGVRWRTYLLYLWPLDTLRASITVVLGGESDQLTPARMVILGAYGLALGAAAWLTFRRLQRQIGDRPPAEGDRTQHG